MKVRCTRRIKAYEELEFKDDFMFGKIMQDSELCRDVLECLLQHPVGELREVEQQKEFRYTSDGKPIRMDIYTRDSDTIYDAEMQNLNNKSIESLYLAKRSRFYQSSIDTDHMNITQSYKTLPDSTILFICTFDPFGKGISRYTFGSICAEDFSIALGDGATRIFFNCHYAGDDICDDLKKLYEYIETGKSESDLTARIDAAVERARKTEEWRSTYMKEMVLLMDARDEGREEEKANTEIERKRADAAEKRADTAEAELAKYKAMYGDVMS